MEFDKVIKNRASIRKYSDKKPDYEKIIKCLEAANSAPSPSNLSIIKFLIVNNKDKIKEIAQACQQDFVGTTDSLIVVCSDSAQCKKLYYERADKYIKQHAGAVIENFLLKVTDLGLASCWVGAFSDETVKRILDIPDNIEIEAILPIAYPHKKTTEKQKHKNEISKILYFDKWKNQTKNKPHMLRD